MTEMSGIEELLSWAKQNGAHVNESISFKKVTGKGVSAFVESKIDPSKPNISIPVKTTVNPNSAIKCFGKDFSGAKDINSITKHFLNYQRSLGKDSFWYMYIALLPEGKEIDSPLYWTKEEKAYLKGTNLGSSLPEVLDSLVEEWFDSVQMIPTRFRDQHYEKNLGFYKQFKEGHIDMDVLNKTDTDLKSWTSFASYLWATTVFKSRSFPYVLIDADTDPKYSMLLPVIDLLNHDPETFVSWTVDESNTNFIFNNNISSILETGSELCNNYGGKGNEELLLGYGFVLEANKNDSVALRIKVPIETLPAIEKFGIRLPKLEDYTTSVYTLKSSQKNCTNYDEFKQGLLYYCNEKDILPVQLLNLFGYLVKNDLERMMSLRMRLDGLTQLRKALELKVNALKDSPDISQISNFRAKKAHIYKEGQRSLLAKMVSEVKDQEKRILKEQKGKIWDLKKILKKDALFASSLLLVFGLRDAQDIEDNGVEDQVLILWLMRCANSTEDFTPSWILNLVKQISQAVTITKSDEEAFKPLYDYFFPALTKKIPEIYSIGDWSLKQMIICGKLIQLISYNRGSKQNPIIVEPIAISV